MNAIFPVIILSSLVIMAIKSPETVLSSFTVATEKAVNLSITLISVYAIWQGLAYLLESSGISKIIAKFFNKPVKKLFGTDNESAIYNISLNLTSNALGLSGMSTPSGIESMKLLDSENNEHGKTLLMVISSTSIQILPISVIQLLATYNQNPTSAIIVSILTTTLSTAVRIILCKVFR